MRLSRRNQLAHRVDIGVAQISNSIDLDWLEWLIAQLGGRDIPRFMQVEAIVGAALAMRVGSGYLDPHHWYCWRRYKQWKRAALLPRHTRRSVLAARGS